MALGALLWIVGEMVAVRKGEDTTTSYVRRGKRLKRVGVVVTVAALVGTSWLWIHFVLDRLG